MSIFGKLPSKEGPITKALRLALKLRKELIGDGTAERDADQIVGQGLKAVLKNPRPESWKFLCDRCHDTGWVNVDPSPEELQRLIRLYGPNPQYQGYVVKCEPCRFLTQEREKRRQQEGRDDESFVAAGRTERKRRF